MQTAILAVSSIGCVFAIGAFAVSLKTALELQKAKKNVDQKIIEVEIKMRNNAKIVKTALGEIQL
jgi:hypothetical protein